MLLNHETREPPLLPRHVVVTDLMGKLCAICTTQFGTKHRLH